MAKIKLNIVEDTIFGGNLDSKSGWNDDADLDLLLSENSEQPNTLPISGTHATSVDTNIREALSSNSDAVLQMEQLILLFYSISPFLKMSTYPYLYLLATL